MIEPLEDRCLLSAATYTRFDRPADPTGLVATPASSTQINIAWIDESSNETGFLVYARPKAGGRFDLVATVPATARRGGVTGYGMTGLNPNTAYVFCVRATNAAGSSGFTRRVAATTSATADAAPLPPTQSTEITYSGPIVIRRGGTYTGNWQSLNPDVPAVMIRTSEPVTILNSNIVSRGTLIDAGGGVNLTIRNTRGYALNPHKYGRYPGRFLHVRGFTNVTLENNYMEGTSGVYLDTYQGNHTAAQTVRVLRNRARNIDGRYSDGRGGFLTGPNDNYLVQFFQINGVHGLVGAEVAWNEVINEPGKSRVEDNVSIHDSSGTRKSPFVIHDNYIYGAYPARPLDNHYTGGGIMLSDNGSSWVQAYNNQVLSTTNYGIAISSGQNNVFYNNRILSAGVMPDGTPFRAQNVGAYIWNQNGESTFLANRGFDNLIGWVQGTGRNDWWVPDASQWKSNSAWRGQITLATEAAEYALWTSKLAAAGVRIGPA